MYGGQVIYKNASALKLGVKCKSLLAVHALSGCDTVSYPFGKGKTSAINTLLLPDVNISEFSDPEASEDFWMKLGISFVARLYGGDKSLSLNSLRFVLFSNKVETPPKLNSYHQPIRQQYNMSNVPVSL